MTELYKGMLAHDYHDPELSDLMEKVWKDTPFMINVFTGLSENDRCREMRDWCRAEFGQENFAIAGKKGDWQFGNVTLFGWNWAGFSTKEQMDQFLEKWADAAKPAIKK